MEVTKSMLEVYFVTDSHGEVIAGPFLYEAQCYEWMDENDE